MTKMLFICALATATMAAPALAGPVDNSVTTSQIGSLEAATRVSPGDGGAYSELAAAYVRAGRMNDAMTAFRRVLTLDNVMLEMPNGDAVWSHQIARRALGSTTTQSFTSL